MMQRAIASAQKHNINLEPGRINSGGGNCSYESVIFNINDRSCFPEKFLMSPDVYRRVWNIDTMNKVLDERIPWNPGMTRKQIVAGFQEVMEPGVYEISFFGDMIMAGIACGVRKIILIFNTNPDISRTGHDPVSVVDPRDYGGNMDSEIPVVVAYNLVHFESLHPVDEHDIEKSIKLVKSYIAKPSRYEQEYGFTGDDIYHLISQKMIKPPQESWSTQKSHKQKQIENSQKNTQESCQTENKESSKTTEMNAKSIDEKQSFKFGGICFEELDNGKTRCGICQVECIRLIVHMNGKEECARNINMAEFKTEYSKYKHRQRMQKTRAQQKAKDLASFRDKVNAGIRKHEAKQKAEDPASFKDNVNARKETGSQAES